MRDKLVGKPADKLCVKFPDSPVMRLALPSLWIFSIFLPGEPVYRSIVGKFVHRPEDKPCIAFA